MNRNRNTHTLDWCAPSKSFLFCILILFAVWIPGYDPWLLPGTIQGTALGILYFLFMTPYFFRERSKVRHFNFLLMIHDYTSGDYNKATALPGTIQGWYYHFLFGVPDNFRGQSKYTHFLYMVPGYFLGRSKVRHSLFPVYLPFPRTIQGTALYISCLWVWPLTFSTNDPRHGILVSCLWSVTCSEDRSRGRHFHFL